MNPELFNGKFDKDVCLINGQTSNRQQSYYLSGPPDQDFPKVSLDTGTELMEGRFVIKEKIRN